MSTSFTGTSRFELLRRLGEGGFGVVHEAFDRDRSTRVALKVLRHGEGASLYRFKREFRALADVSHLNLVALDELLTDGRHWFFTMELVRGETIVSYVRRLAERDVGRGGPPGRVDEHRLRPVLRQLVDGLTTLHRSGIVHRDVKPPNVLVTPEGRLVVLDFGLVSERDPASADEDQVGEPSTDGLVVLGTPAYMAPEQGGSWQAAPAADWYSVGVVLYEALTGQLPFDGRGLEQLEAKQAGRPRPPCEIAPDVSQDLSDVCLGLLEPDPDLRYGADALLKVSGTAVGVVLSDSAASASEPLFGRESQLQALGDAFEAAARGETVVALVSGASGMGKSALIRHFLNERRHSEPALITLMSRCYERESMPYKAIDPLVDALARHLQRLRDIEVARLLPRDVGTLARVFPVLLAVEEIKRAPEYATTGLDSIGIRRRAATALRDVLFDLAVRYPLVLAIDDAQWGDADSAAILQEVLRPPDAPPLLLIAAYRSEDAGNAPLVTALERFARDGTTGQPRHIVVNALTEQDSTRLALHLSPPDGDGAAFASNIAHESGGNPFFVQELAQHAVTAGKPTRLDDVVRDRVLSLPDPSRRLMTAIALSAQSIPAAVAEAAAEIVPDEREPLRLLRAARLVRAPVQSDDVRTLEPYHDRIREAVIAQLSPTGLSHCHRRLADAWERSGLARPETLTTHFLGAGDQVQAIAYAAQAAKRAEETLAFDRAAGFYSLLVRLDKPEQQRRWRVALGDSLVNAGRGYEAALAYLDALELTTGEERLDLERRAAAELIRAGYLDRAKAVLDSLLPKVGLSPPGSPARALATLLGYRALLALRGVKVRERPESAIPLEELRRIDVLVAIGPPLSLISLPHGLSLNIQGTWYALRAGEPKRAAVGLALMASTLSMGGSRTLRKTSRLVEQAKALAEPQQDAWTTARTLLADGIALKVSGHWRDGVERLERAIESFNACPGARWEIETAQTIRHDAMIWTGDWRKLANELPARWHEAEQRGDRYSAAHVAGRLSPLMQLAADRSAEARAGAEAALSHWTKPHFNMQHRAALCTWLDIELYDGRPEKASARLGDAWPALRGTLALFQNGRIEAQFYRARIALALAAAGQRARLTEATHVARRLSREGAAYATALATLVDATVACANGRADDALTRVALAERQLVECDMKLYAASARYRRGRLMGGDTGRELADAAMTVMREEGVINTARMIELLTPGPW